MDEKNVLFFSVVEASFHNELSAKFQYLDSLVKGNRSNHPSFVKIFSISYYLVANNPIRLCLKTLLQVILNTHLNKVDFMLYF